MKPQGQGDQAMTPTFGTHSDFGQQTGFGTRGSVWSRLALPPTTPKEIASGRILREDVHRKILEEEVRQGLEMEHRMILEEELRRQLEMEHYYDLRYPNLGYHGTRGRRDQAPRNQFKRKHSWVREVQNTTMESKEELMSEPPFPNRNDTDKQGDGFDVLKLEGGSMVEQLTFCRTPIMLNKDTEACGSKRKGDSISAVSTPAATSASVDKLVPKKAKRQKTEKKEYNCTLCKVTANTDNSWFLHLNGKRHQKTLKRLAQVETIKMVSSDVDNKGTPGIGLAAVGMEIKEGELMPEPPLSTDEDKQSDEEDIQKKKGKKTVQIEENGNNAESNVNEMSHKIVKAANGFGLQAAFGAHDSVWSRLTPAPSAPEEIASGRVLREETRRRILKEEVRREVEMECYYGRKYLNLIYQGIRGQRSWVPHNRFKKKHWCWMREVPKTTMETEEGELMPEPSLNEDKVKQSNEEEIQKINDEQTAQPAENGNKIKSCVSEMPCKIMELTGEESRPPQTLTSLKENILSSKNQEELNPKASLSVQADALPTRNNIHMDGKENIQSSENQEELNPKASLSVQADALPNRNNIYGDGDGDGDRNGNNLLNPEGENKELNKDAEASESKRQLDSVSALSTPAATSGSVKKLGPKKAKRKKTEKKEYNCTICGVTATTDDSWLLHLNGKRHQKTLKRSAQVGTHKTVSSDVGNTGTQGIGPKATIKEMNNNDGLAIKPTGEQLPADEGIIQKLQVGHVEHEVEMSKAGISDVHSTHTPGNILPSAKMEMNKSGSVARKPEGEQLQADGGVKQRTAGGQCATACGSTKLQSAVGSV